MQCAIITQKLVWLRSGNVIYLRARARTMCIIYYSYLNSKHCPRKFRETYGWRGETGGSCLSPLRTFNYHINRTSSEFGSLDALLLPASVARLRLFFLFVCVCVFVYIKNRI